MFFTVALCSMAFVPATLVPATLVPATLVPATLVPATLVPATLGRAMVSSPMFHGASDIPMIMLMRCFHRSCVAHLYIYVIIFCNYIIQKLFIYFCKKLI